MSDSSGDDGRNDSTGAAPRYYGFEGRALRVREWWHSAQGIFSFLAAVLIYRLPFRIVKPNLGLRLPTIWNACRLEDVPTGPQESLRKLVEEWQDAGFSLGFVYSPSYLGPMRAYVAALLGPEGRIVAVCIHYDLATANIDMTVRASTTSLWSRCADGRILSTLRSRRQFDPVPGHESVFLPKVDLATVLTEHRRRLADESILSLELSELPGAQKELESETLNHLVERGVYRELSEAERIELEEKGPEALVDAKGERQFLCKRCGDFQGSIEDPGNRGVCEGCKEKVLSERLAKRRQKFARVSLILCVCLWFFTLIQLSATRIFHRSVNELGWLPMLGATVLSLIPVLLFAYALGRGLADHWTRSLAKGEKRLNDRL